MNQKQMQQMMKQAQKMQADIAKAQAEVDAMEITTRAGGGAVEVTVSGNKRIKTLQIDEAILDPEDKEVIEQMILSAVNDALTQIDEMSEQKMGAVTGGMNLPF